MEAFREFKRIWDPENRMNPGKVIDARPLDADPRLGVDHNPPRPETKFHWIEDGGDFAHATLRCVGVGKCRMPHGVDVMCPSFIATREEKHTTRGRARLLFEMLEGSSPMAGAATRSPSRTSGCPARAAPTTASVPTRGGRRCAFSRPPAFAS